MTTTNDVTKALIKLRDAGIPNNWLLIIDDWVNNDIIKKQLAISHDEWTTDMINNDVQPSSLKEHIIYYIENNELIESFKK